jgi:hypothetical protein
LLAGIAPADATPPVVSNPENGWFALREILETDLRARGAVLMQQVRTLLLGLRQLIVLTPRAYRRAGGMSGVETLVVARALRSAGEALGGGEAGVRTARVMLNALVLPAGADQPPKARRPPLSALAEIAGDPERAQRALQTLQADEIVRPAGGDASESAWQLDHDYLARSVLAEMRQADRWGTALRDGFSRFRAAGGSWHRGWAALLPVSVQVRLLWERARGRLKYGEASVYARLSGAKPAVLLAVCAGVAWGALALYREDLVRSQAQALANKFGAQDRAAVLEAWQAPGPVRMRVFALVTADTNLLLSASAVGWPTAHAGVEPGHALEAARLLANGLKREQGNERALAFARAYADVAQRLPDQTAIKTAAETLHSQPLDRGFVHTFATAYAAVAKRLQDQTAIKVAAEALRSQLEHAQGNLDAAAAFATDYAAVAQKLQDQTAIKAEAEALRGQLGHAMNRSLYATFASAYAAVAQNLQDQSAIKTEAEALRGRLEHEPDSSLAAAFATAYAAVAQNLQDQTAIRTAAEALLGRLEHEPDSSLAAAFSTAYAAVAQKLQDQSAIKTEAEALRGQLGHALNRSLAATFASAYAAIARKLQDQTAIETAAEALRSQWEHEPLFPHLAADFACAYAAVAQKLQGQTAIRTAAEALRGRLEHEPDSSLAAAFATAYAAVAQKLQDQSAIRTEAEALRGRLEHEPDSSLAAAFATAYAAVAQKLQDQTAIETAAEALRSQLEHAPDSLLVGSFAGAFAAVAHKVQNKTAIETAAEVLRSRLERAQDPSVAAAFAGAYAAVAGRWLEMCRGDREREVQITRHILAMAGHPFLQDPTTLLAALEPLAKHQFGDDIGAAVAWWADQYKGDVASLRPPLPSLQ